jgi:hypothetical protein
MHFTIDSFYVRYYIHWFTYIILSLNSWNETNMIMEYDLSNVFLGSVSKCFIEEFCCYIHQWFWLLKSIFLIDLYSCSSRILLIQFFSVFFFFVNLA